MTGPLIRTKLRLPFTRSELVHRSRLLQKMEQGLRGQLTLIVAPAGFGKTTLAASSVVKSGYRAAWISLNKDDNRERLFLNYLIAALQEVDEAIGNEAAQLIMASALPEVILTSLINDLDTISTDIVLVLDDFHLISSKDVHKAVTFLLDYGPETFHLLITSRSNPPLSLTRLRAREQILELYTADLSFTETEADQFLNGVMGLHLDAGAISVLEERTEGWIAGLQLAALTIRDRDDVPGFIRRFSGTNRYILDYLMEEVLIQQPPEIQHFLLHTSILERLSAPLCDALLERDDSDTADDLPPSIAVVLTSQAASILEDLERQNLFLIPLDDDRVWFRYHHLFADLLRARMQQTLSDSDVITLHRRAAHWYEKNGLAYEAIYHASLTSDNEWIERLIEQNYMEMMQRGESLSIRVWTGQLSKELIYQRPLLCAHEAMSRAWFGQLDEADDFLMRAEEHLKVEEHPSTTRFMKGYIAYGKSRVAAMRGKIQQAISLGFAAQEYISPSNEALWGGIGVMLGYAYFLDGDFTNASQTLINTIQAGIAAEAVNTTTGAYCVLARLFAIQGLLHKSYETYQEARDFIENIEGQHQGAMSIVDAGLAEVQYEWNDLEAAHVSIQKGLASINLWGKPDDIAMANATLACIQLSRGEINDATKTIGEASRLITSSGVFFESRDIVTTTEIRIQHAKRDTLALNRWSDSLEEGANLENLFSFNTELKNLTLARVYIAQDRLNDAMDLLSQLEINAQSGGRTGRLIKIIILKAMALQKTGNSPEALLALEDSLKLAMSRGYIRTFLDESAPMQMLLAQWLAHGSTSSLRDYVVHLLSQFDVETETISATQKETTPNDILIEPLTERELEVLHIMALGKTNHEIAQQLVVARGTVKAHTASIYRKLDVSNRTEAVTRARQLGILP